METLQAPQRVNGWTLEEELILYNSVQDMMKLKKTKLKAFKLTCRRIKRIKRTPAATCHYWYSNLAPRIASGEFDPQKVLLELESATETKPEAPQEVLQETFEFELKTKAISEDIDTMNFNQIVDHIADQNKRIQLLEKTLPVAEKALEEALSALRQLKS